MAAGDDGVLAVVAHRHAAAHAGGAEISAATLVQGLRALGYRTALIAVAQPGETIPLDADEFLLPADPAHYDAFYHLSGVEAGLRLRRLLEGIGARAVFAHHFLDLGINVLRDIPLPTILTLHEYLAICHHHGQMVTRPERALCHAAAPEACAACFPHKTPRQFALRRAAFLDAFAGIARFVAPSAFLARRYAAWGLAADRIDVIENGLPDRGHPAAPPPGLSGGPVTIGYFGRITPFKGVDVLVRAAERLARDPALRGRVTIRVHGGISHVEQTLRNALMAQTRPPGVVSYHGAYRNADVARLMAACDYVVVPSMWWENSPLVIQEAFAAGRPVIGSDLGGIAEKVGPHGLTFPVGDDAGLARTIAAAADPQRLAELSRALPRPADATTMARAYLQTLARAEAAPPVEEPAWHSAI